MRNLPRVSTPHARPRLEPTTSRSQVQYFTDIATTPREALNSDEDALKQECCLARIAGSGTQFCTAHKFKQAQVRGAAHEYLVSSFNVKLLTDRQTEINGA